MDLTIPPVSDRNISGVSEPVVAAIINDPTPINILQRYFFMRLERINAPKIPAEEKIYEKKIHEKSFFPFSQNPDKTPFESAD